MTIRLGLKYGLVADVEVEDGEALPAGTHHATCGCSDCLKARSAR